MSIYQEYVRQGKIIDKEESAKKVQNGKLNRYSEIEDKIETGDCDLNEHCRLLKELTISKRVKLILTTLGLNSKNLTFTEKLVQLIRLIPLCQKSYNILELGGPGTGKSTMYNKTFHYSYVISGEMTEPLLFGDVRKEGDKGILSNYSVVAIDEIAELTDIKASLATKIRTFMADGNAGRGNKSNIVDTSIVLLGNLKGNQNSILENPKLIGEIDLYEYIPKELNGNPMKERIDFFNPGWELDINSESFVKQGEKGFNSIYYSNILKLQREQELKLNILIKNKGNRESTTLKRTVEGLIKLIFGSSENISEDDLEVMLVIAEYGIDLRNGKYKNLFKRMSMKKFTIKLLEEDLKEISNKETTEIQEIYFYENRINVKYYSENYIYKIALNKLGRLENKKEFEAYQKNKNLNISPIQENYHNYLYITQEYKEPISKSKLLKDLDKIFESKPTLYLKIEDNQIRSSLEEIVKSYEKTISSQNKKINLLEKALKESKNQLDENMMYINQQFRKVKLELLEHAIEIENLKGTSPYETSIKQFAPFVIKEIKSSNLESISNINIESDCYLNEKKEICYINFANYIY